MAIKKSRSARFQSLVGLGARVSTGALASLGRRITSGREASVELLHQKTAAQLLESFSSMKGLPMKVGQILSFMDGVVPPQYQDIYRKSLSKLQTQSQPHSWDEMRIILEEELGAPVESVFSNIDKVPMASASIGQVYRGQLLGGAKVAIKIQYPEIREALASDIKNVGGILSLMNRVLPSLDFSQVSDDILSRFAEETDYLKEAENQQAFVDFWQNSPRVVVPKVFHEHCRSRVLVTELQAGKNFAEVVKSEDPERKSAYGRTIFWFTYHSILTGGLFNTDPHPGNYLFQPDERVVFLDFGSVQKYDEETRLALKSLLHSVVQGKRGQDLWSELEEKLLIPPGTSPEVQKMFLDYLLFVMEPILSPQPYRYTPEFTSKVSELSFETKMLLAKGALRLKWKEPKRQGLGPLIRILFGLNSILASLETEQDWQTLSLEA